MFSLKKINKLTNYVVAVLEGEIINVKCDAVTGVMKLCSSIFTGRLRIKPEYDVALLASTS